MDISEAELRGSSEITGGKALFMDEVSDSVVDGPPPFGTPFRSGEGRTVRIDDSDRGEATVWQDDLITVVLYSELVEFSGR